MKRFLTIALLSLGITCSVAAQEAAPANATADTPAVTEDQLTELQAKAVAELPPAGTTNVFFLERFPERIQEFVNPGKYVPLHLRERLSEEIALKAKGDDKGAERVLRAHLEMLDHMEQLGRAKPALAGPFNDTLGQLALCYRKLEHDQQDFEAAQQLFNEIRDQNLELAAVINPDVTPPGPVLEALTRANVIKPEQVGELRTMEQVVAALRAKRTDVDKANRGTLLAMMEAALARKYLQDNANAFVASRMAELTAEATMLRDAIEADNRDTSDAMVNNMMQLAGALGYHEGFGSDPFSQQMRDAIGRFRKGEKVNLGRLFEDQFKDTITDRFRALQSGDVINPDYADRYLGIVNRNTGRPDVGIHGFDPEKFRRNLTDFGYDPSKFKDFDERQRKMREAGDNCYRQNKVPFVKNYENAEIECRDRSYVSGPSPEQYRAKQEECAKQGKGVRYLGGDRLECEGGLGGGPYPTPTTKPGSTYGSPTTACGAGQIWVAKDSSGYNWECKNEPCPPGYYRADGVQPSCWLSNSTSTYSQSPIDCGGGTVYDAAVRGCRKTCQSNEGYNPSTGNCEVNGGGGGSCGIGNKWVDNRCSPVYCPTSSDVYDPAIDKCGPYSGGGGGGSYDPNSGPPGNGCPSGQVWQGNGSNPISWRCITGSAPNCEPGFHWVSGSSKNGVNYSSGCWPGSTGGGGSTSTYTPPTYSSSYSPYCSSSQNTPSSGWYLNPNTTCPSGQYVTEWCPTAAKVEQEKAQAIQSNYSYSYPGTAWGRCPNPPAQ